MLYDIEANIIVWELSKGKISQAKEIGNLVIHITKSNKPVLIEILEASKYTGQFEKIKSLNDIKKALPAS